MPSCPPGYWDDVSARNMLISNLTAGPSPVIKTSSLEEICLGFVCSRNLTASCYSADPFAVCILNPLGRTTFFVVQSKSFPMHRFSWWSTSHLALTQCLLNVIPSHAQLKLKTVSQDCHLNQVWLAHKSQESHVLQHCWRGGHGQFAFPSPRGEVRILQGLTLRGFFCHLLSATRTKRKCC